MSLDADTGKVVWEYKVNIFQSDIPAHRVGWPDVIRQHHVSGKVSMPDHI